VSDELDESMWPDDFHGASNLVHTHLINRMKAHVDEFKAEGQHTANEIATFMAEESSDCIYAAFILGVVWRDAYPHSPVPLRI
jgi:hypothetical protein